MVHVSVTQPVLCICSNLAALLSRIAGYHPKKREIHPDFLP
jgi:hypothetical protein